LTSSEGLLLVTPKTALRKTYPSTRPLPDP
jgi:hypothetical protein